MEGKFNTALLPLRDIVVFPCMVIPLFVGRDKSINALNDMQKFDLNINPEIASENLRIVAKEIGSMTNIIDVEEILDDIFSSFCIGK